jgi:hypothetical protein
MREVVGTLMIHASCRANGDGCEVCPLLDHDERKSGIIMHNRLEENYLSANSGIVRELTRL